MSTRNAIKSQFCEITQAPPDVAIAYLEKHRWKMNQALKAYFDTQRTQPVASEPTKKLIDLYNKYKDPEQPDIILIDGTLMYLGDLGFDPEDLVTLTLAYVLRSPQTGEFSKEVFLEVWGDLGISTIREMRRYILDHHQVIKGSPKDYEKLYQYVFDFVRGSDTRIKAIGYEDAVLYWRMLFADFSAQERLEQWYTFITSHKRNVSKDAWNMFYKFAVQVIETDPANLSGYDEMSAWPSVIDEYMEWLAENGHIEAR